MGAAKGETSGGRGGRRGGETCARRFHPPGARPPTAPILRPVTPPAPLHPAAATTTTGNARSQGGGEARASGAPRSPLGPSPFPSPYLCFGCPAAAPEVPAAPAAGLQGLSARARRTPSAERAGAGHASCGDWRREQPIGGRLRAPDVTWRCGYDCDSSRPPEREAVWSRRVYPQPSPHLELRPCEDGLPLSVPSASIPHPLV